MPSNNSTGTTSPTSDEYSTWNGKTDTSSIRTNPLKFSGEPTFSGIHRITDEALQGPYNLLTHNDFGSTNVKLHHGETVNVKRHDV